MFHSGKRIPHFPETNNAIRGGPPGESRHSSHVGRLRKSQGSEVSHLLLAALLLLTLGAMLWALVQLASA
jgi:hypothetical protein